MDVRQAESRRFRPGLKLIGFGIWERRGGAGRNVTFPARKYAVNGERRSFALLRPAGSPLTAGANRVSHISARWHRWTPGYAI